jgi:hypothetical protein
MVHLLPQVFPDIKHQDEAEQKRLGKITTAVAPARLRNHFRMIFYLPAKRDVYTANMATWDMTRPSRKPSRRRLRAWT